MNLRLIKTKWNISFILSLIGLSFWFLETIFFIVRDGYHYAAVHNSEKICDTIALWICRISVFIFFTILVDIVRWFASLYSSK